MRPLIRSTVAGAVMLPAVLTISGWTAGAAAASSPPPAITVAAGSHGAPSSPASPDPAMPGMDMSGSNGPGSMPGMDMGTGSTGPAPSGGHSGHNTRSASAPWSHALVLAGFAAVNVGVLLVAAVMRRRNPPRRAVAPPRRSPVGLAISPRPAIAADARGHHQGASA